MSDDKSFLQRHHFLLRRLHSLTGIAPIGVFLIFHLTTNSSILWGEMSRDGGVASFQHEVNFIHSMPALILLEVFGLWLPIAFHSILGVIYTVGAKPNNLGYTYPDNWRYTLQRISGWIGLIYIFYHVATLRWQWTWLPFSSAFDPQAAASTTAIALRGGADTAASIGGVAVGALYLIGITMLVFHFANGLWTAAITWGLTISESAQRRWGYICVVIGAGLMGMGWGAYIGFVTLDLEEARRIEAEMLGAPPAAEVSRDRAPTQSVLTALSESR